MPGKHKAGSRPENHFGKSGWTKYREKLEKAAKVILDIGAKDALESVKAASDAAKAALDAENALKDKLEKEKAARAALTTAAKDARNAEKVAKDRMNAATAAKDALMKDLKEAEAQRRFEQDRRIAEEGKRCDLENQLQKKSREVSRLLRGY